MKFDTFFVSNLLDGSNFRILNSLTDLNIAVWVLENRLYHQRLKTFFSVCQRYFTIWPSDSPHEGGCKKESNGFSSWLTNLTQQFQDSKPFMGVLVTHIVLFKQGVWGNIIPYCNVQTWRTFSYSRIALKSKTNMGSNFDQELPDSWIRKLKWPNCSKLCAQWDELFSGIQFKSHTSCGFL